MHTPSKTKTEFFHQLEFHVKPHPQPHTSATLDSSERSWHSTFDKLHDALLVVRANGEILYANPSANDLLGIRNNALQQYSLFNRNGHHLEECASQNSVILREDLTASAVEKLPTPWGNSNEILLRLHPQNTRNLRITSGNILSPAIMQHLQRLASQTAHAVNDYLSIMTGYLRLLRRASTDEQRKRALDRIDAACHKSMEWNKGLRQFAQTGHRPQHIFPIHPLLLDMQKELEDKVPTGIRVLCALDARQDKITGDPSCLRSAVRHILQNAIHAMPKGGLITIATERTNEAEARLRLSISDTGIGASEEVVCHMPEPLFTHWNNPAEQHAGLGLSIVYGITRQHGGEMRIASVPGAGTTIALYFPIAKG